MSETTDETAPNDILIEVTPLAAAALPPELLEKLQAVASALESAFTTTPAMTCQKVFHTECAVFTECTDVTF